MSELPERVSQFRDQYGKTRYRYRSRGVCIALNATPGTEEFSTLLHNARLVTERRGRTRKGTANHRPPDSLMVLRFEHYCKKAVFRAKFRVKKLRVPYSLSYEYISALLRQQTWRCAVSGIPFDVPQSGRPSAFGPSLDRIVPKLGYTVGNVRIVAHIVNCALNEWGEKPLFRLLEAMANLAKSKKANQQAIEI